MSTTTVPAQGTGRETGTSRSIDTNWLDLVRGLAIAAVVLIHTSSSIVSSARGIELTYPRWWVGNLLDSLGRSSVPLFVMVSGALLLASGRREACRDFYVRRLRRIGVPLAFWSLAYLCFRRFVLEEHIGLRGALSSLAHARPYFHLYFLFLITGLYLVTPLLRLVLDHASQRFGVGLCSGLLALGALDQVIRCFFGAGEPNALTYWLPYAGYFLAGHLLATWSLPSRAVARTAALVFVGSTAFTAVGTWYLASPTGWGDEASYLYGYLSPSVMLASLAAFVLIRVMPKRLHILRRPMVVRIIRQLSVLSFGLYLIHPLVQYAYDTYGPGPVRPTRAPELFGTLVTEWAVVCVVTLALTALLRSVPLLRRIL